MQYVLIIHEVDDYQEWKKGFDHAAGKRKEAGELEYRVLAFENDQNKVVHFSKWVSHVQAKSFFESEEVKQIRKDLGVKDPNFIYLDELEQGVL